MAGCLTHNLGKWKAYDLPFASHRPLSSQQVCLQDQIQDGDRTILAAIHKKDWMVLVDVEDTYFEVPVHLESCENLGFLWWGHLLHFLVLCFILSTTPQVFMNDYTDFSNFTLEGSTPFELPGRLSLISLLWGRNTPSHHGLPAYSTCVPGYLSWLTGRNLIFLLFRLRLL